MLIWIAALLSQTSYSSQLRIGCNLKVLSLNPYVKPQADVSMRTPGSGYSYGLWQFIPNKDPGQETILARNDPLT